VISQTKLKLSLITLLLQEKASGEPKAALFSLCLMVMMDKVQNTPLAALKDICSSAMKSQEFSHRKRSSTDNIKIATCRSHT